MTDINYTTFPSFEMKKYWYNVSLGIDAITLSPLKSINNPIDFMLRLKAIFDYEYPNYIKDIHINEDNYIDNIKIETPIIIYSFISKPAEMPTQGNSRILKIPEPIHQQYISDNNHTTIPHQIIMNKLSMFIEDEIAITSIGTTPKEVYELSYKVLDVIHSHKLMTQQNGVKIRWQQTLPMERFDTAINNTNTKLYNITSVWKLYTERAYYHSESIIKGITPTLIQIDEEEQFQAQWDYTTYQRLINDKLESGEYTDMTPTVLYPIKKED